MIIILYVMDSLRPDFLSCYGYQKETSPNIDALAREGVLFTNAFAQSTWTRTSGASILSSSYPSVHGLFTAQDFFPLNLPTLPEQLKGAGFKTVALSAIAGISPYFGFGKGFDHFVEIYKEKVVIQKNRVLKRNNAPIPTSEDINDLLFFLLQQNGRTDMFILIWSVDTHNPYFHRDTELARFAPLSHEIFWAEDVNRMRAKHELLLLKALYEEMIFYNDHHIGSLIHKLKELNLFEETFLIITGDHGESFGEHSANGHGGAPFDEQIRVPLIMKFPHSKFQGESNGLVQHIDLVPTILEAVGMNDTHLGFQGKTLFPLLKEGVTVNDFVFIEAQPKKKFPGFVAFRTLNFKYIQIAPGKITLQKSLLRTLSPLRYIFGDRKLLFDLKKDPAELVNISRRKKQMTRQFQMHVKAIRMDCEERSRSLKIEKKPRPGSDEEVSKQLRALGYFDG
jgi:arylsulfatase A-like enzyme